MKIIVAPDKFKGSLTSQQASECMASGILQTDSKALVWKFPMADGGDGFAEVLKYYLSTETVSCNTFDPLLRPMTSVYQWDQETKTAIIELASASGLLLLSEDERNPLKTTTFGTGILILHAIKNGAEKILLGLGGSATNDAGIGILAALGFQILDKNERQLLPIGGNLQQLHNIIPPSTTTKISFEIACDVQNTLFGSKGAAYVYAGQKGATSDDLKYLDESLQHFADLLQRKTGKDVANFWGTGAAGGVAAGLSAYLDVIITEGADLIIKKSKIEHQLQGTDLIITGEGKLDKQSSSGKVIAHISALGKKHKIPVIAICGMVDIGLEKLKEMGLNAAIEISKGVPEHQAIVHAGELLTKASATALADYIRSSRSKI
jgi:glycerate kinase